VQRSKKILDLGITTTQAAASGVGAFVRRQMYAPTVKTAGVNSISAPH
jgi:hypothetical protein